MPTDSSLRNKQQTLPVCSAGRSDCDVISELVELRGLVMELSTLVRTDTLTGLANYRYFMQALEQELERTGRTGQPTTLVMLDIDFFKRVNDEWGHEVGNLALTHVAHLLKQTVRKLDIPCRYGGEEFAIILPNTPLVTSLQVAERLRLAIEKTPLAVADDQLRLTASLGVSSYELGEDICPEELVQRADHYLYQAKQQGRNQVCHPTLPVIEQVSREERGVLFELFGSGSGADDDR